MENSICYEIWPQNLGYPLTGVKYTTRPDFVFKCVSLNINGESKSFEQIQEVKNIIIYLDGYQFHATNENKRVLSDLKIRDAITQSGRYHLWIFSWEDLTNFAVNKTEDSFFKKINFEAISKISSKHPLLKSFDLTSIKKLNSYTKFCVFLKQPLLNFDLQLWSSVQLFASQTRLLDKCLAIDNVDSFLDSGKEADYVFEQSKPDQFALCDSLKFEDELKIICLGQPATFEIKSGIFHTLPAADYDKANWEFFWQTYNLVQFSYFKGVERESVSSDTTESIHHILENFRPELHEIVKVLVAKKISINNEFDFDVLEDDVIIAQAELGSESHKFFMYAFNEESRNELTEKGFKEYTIENFNANHL